MNDFLKKYKIPVIAGGVALVLLVVVLAIWQYDKSVSNKGEASEKRIEQVYRNAQNSLSTCIDQGAQSAQVAKQELQQVKDILVATASARYVDQNGKSTGASKALGGGAFVSALQENYPNIDVETFKNLQTVVVGCRDEYQGAQDRLFYEIQKFETWVQEDNIFNQGIKAGFPSNVLTVTNITTGKKLKGQDALDYMSRVITVKAASDAYGSGQLDQQDLFGGGN